MEKEQYTYIFYQTICVHVTKIFVSYIHNKILKQKNLRMWFWHNIGKKIQSKRLFYFDLHIGHESTINTNKFKQKTLVDDGNKIENNNQTMCIYIYI